MKIFNTENERTSGEAVGKTLVFNERLEGVLRKDGWRYIISGRLPDAWEHTQRTRDFDMYDQPVTPMRRLRLHPP